MAHRVTGAPPRRCTSSERRGGKEEIPPCPLLSASTRHNWASTPAAKRARSTSTCKRPGHHGPLPPEEVYLSYRSEAEHSPEIAAKVSNAIIPFIAEEVPTAIVGFGYRSRPIVAFSVVSRETNTTKQEAAARFPAVVASAAF